MNLFAFDKVTMRYHYTRNDLFTSVSFTIQEGETVTLLAQAQSGKSTIAKLLMGVQKHTAGRILFRNSEYSSANKDKGIVYLPAKPILFVNKSVEYNLAYPLIIRGTPRQDAYAKARQIAPFYGLDSKVKAKKLNSEKAFDLCLARAKMRQISLVIADSLPQKLLDKAIILSSICQCALLILTDDYAQAHGKTLIMYNNTIAHTGDCQSAKDYLSDKLWINNAYINKLSADNNIPIVGDKEKYEQ